MILLAIPGCQFAYSFSGFDETFTHPETSHSSAGSGSYKNVETKNNRKDPDAEVKKAAAVLAQAALGVKLKPHIPRTGSAGSVRLDITHR